MILSDYNEATEKCIMNYGKFILLISPRFPTKMKMMKSVKMVECGDDMAAAALAYIKSHDIAKAGQIAIISGESGWAPIEIK